MASDDETLNAGAGGRRWPGAMAFSALIVLLVALGATEEFGTLTVLILGSVFVAAGLFLWMFPGSRFFVLAFVNSLAIYSSIYAFLTIANFANAEPWAIAAGYLLPIAVFLASVACRRVQIRRISQAEELRRAYLSGRDVVWLAPMFVIMVLTFALPDLMLDPAGTSLVLVGAMAVAAALVAAVSRQISLFLIDTGLLFDRFFVRAGRLVRPAFAFFTLYSFIVIVFAMIFRLMDRVSATPIFVIEGEPGRIGFPDSLYFSLITMSTVGYGDITPGGDAVRVAAGIEILLGILLFLFGFAEIMRYARGSDGGGGNGR